MTPLPIRFVGASLPDCGAPTVGCRAAVEILIDDITEQSFPASDPPAWGIASSRLEQAVWCSQRIRSNCSVHHT
jgi:hypothetical protein